MKWTLMILLLSLSTAFGPPLPGCSVTAEEGETVILPANVNLTEELLIPVIKWIKGGEGIVHEYRYNNDHNEHQIERFKGRTSLFKEEINKGNVSLEISNITKIDTGKYICEVHVADEMIYKVSLCVKEKSKLEDPTQSSEQEQPGLTTGQTAGIVIGVLALAAALTGAVFLYKKRQGPNNNRDQAAQKDGQEMYSIGGGGKGRGGRGGADEVSGEPGENSLMVGD